MNKIYKTKCRSFVSGSYTKTNPSDFNANSWNKYPNPKPNKTCIISGVFLIFGLTIFLLGVDLGIQPIGERAGAELTKKRNLPLLVGVAFIIGFLVTISEPDIQVFGDQVKGVFPKINKLIPL